MKNGNGKIVVGVVVAAILVLIGLAAVFFAFAKREKRKSEPNQLRTTSNPPALQAKNRVKIKTRELDVDGMKMMVTGEMSKDELENIKSQLPKNLKNGASISVVVSGGDGKSMKMTPEMRMAMAKAVREQLEKAFAKMPPEDREKMRKALNSPEGEKALHDSVMTYNKKLTGEQRKSADPAFQAILKTLSDIKEGKK